MCVLKELCVILTILILFFSARQIWQQFSFHSFMWKPSILSISNPQFISTHANRLSFFTVLYNRRRYFRYRLKELYIYLPESILSIVIAILICIYCTVSHNKIDFIRYFTFLLIVFSNHQRMESETWHGAIVYACVGDSVAELSNLTLLNP